MLEYGASVLTVNGSLELFSQPQMGKLLCGYPVDRYEHGLLPLLRTKVPCPAYFGSLMISAVQIIKTATVNLQPANPDILEGVDDLTQLSYLNEPAVLHNLQYRYDSDMIYVSRVYELCVIALCFKYCTLF